MRFYKEHPVLVRIALSVLLAIISFCFLANIATSVDTHKTTFDVIDKEKTRVTNLLTASTSASALLSMLKDDICTPIAEKLADLSHCFVCVLSILFTEKYLLTFIGWVVFKVLIPTVCCLDIILAFLPWQKIRKYMWRIVIVGFVIFHLIPISTLVSEKIEETFHETIDATMNAAMNSGTENDDEEVEDKGWFQNIIDEVVDSAMDTLNWAKTVLNNFVEATAIIIVTSCVIPVLVCICILVLLEKVLNINIPWRTRQKALKKRRRLVEF